MNSLLHIDWLSLTFPNVDGLGMRKAGDVHYWNDILGEHYTRDTSKWRVSKPLYGYKEAYISAYGTLVMYGTEGMGLHAQYSGQALQNLTSVGIVVGEIISNANSLGARATRIDVACDLIGGSATVHDFHVELLRGRVNTPAKTWRIMQNSASGYTLYLGSRVSERMARVYDKKAERAAHFEQTNVSSWIRVEVELKGEQARNFLKACRDNEVYEVMRSYLIATCDFSVIPDFKTAVTGNVTNVEPTKTKRKDTKTRHWLMSKIAPVIAREIAHDIAFWATLQTEINTLREQLLRPKDPDKPMPE